VKKYTGFLLLALIQYYSFGQQFTANYDEAKIPAYSLPDPLVFNNGTAVKSLKDWGIRRVEIYSDFEKQVFGAVPKWNGNLRWVVLSSKDDAIGGIAKRREVRLELSNGIRKNDLTILIYLPQNSKDAPIFLNYNFDGNHTVTTESDVVIPDSWVSNNKELGILDNHASENGRGKAISRWPIKEIVSRGFGLATVYYGDVDPDFDDGFKNGVHQLFDSRRDSTSWGSVAAWAWGLSRIMDYFEKDQEINANRIIVMGHSRLGKAALWAGASDQRFAMVVSNCSGCGGAALSKRIYGETVGSINNTFPHWFCNNFKKYNTREDLLPVDQHELIALIAPRPVYVASAADDRWADPKGEFLACVFASPVYELLGSTKFAATKMPMLSTPILGDISYHIRPGKHDVTLYDWNCYMDAAGNYFKSKK